MYLTNRVLTTNLLKCITFFWCLTCDNVITGVQAAYWVMLDEGRITQTMANLLMLSVDEAIDLVSHEALCDWKCLKSYLNIPNHYKFLQSSIVPQKLVTYFTVERLESQCYISAAFLSAHRTARLQLQKFIGKNLLLTLLLIFKLWKMCSLLPPFSFLVLFSKENLQLS